MTNLRLAIISDIHADIGDSEDTYVVVQPPVRPRNEHPIRDLHTYVEARSLQADYVLCPGDLSNKASDPGKAYAWLQLHELAHRLGAAGVFATPGNHDLTTHEPVPDPAATLRLLSPSYPTGDPNLDDEFWRTGLTIIELDDFRFLLLNSCYDYPTHPGEDASEADLRDYFSILDQGGFPRELQVRLEDRLASLESRAVNVAMIHHHPLEHESRRVFKDSYGPMRRGAELVRVLDEHPTCGRWFIIHGHKHVPRLISAAGDSANSPVMLGAASVGGRLWHPIVTVTRNQFHIVEFELDSQEGLAPMRGTIESHMWGFGAGWDLAARRSSGLPARCGFGFPVDHRALAASVAGYLTSRAIEFEHWEPLIQEIPALRYQGPRDFEMFESQLNSAGLQLMRDAQDRIRQVAREVVE